MNKFLKLVTCIGVATFIPYLFTVASVKEAQAQTLYEDGFYRKDGNSVVFRLFTRNGERLSCGVASDQHLQNLGGEGRVNILSKDSSELGSGRRWVGTCDLVDGFYRVNTKGVVWWLYSRGEGTDRQLYACGIGSGAQLARLGGATQVQNLPRGAEAGAQRSWQGTCPDRI
ncbi:MAG: hypothetical protein KME32_13010 [Mojavia pulchra JT2-VF2]|jgi:hypothetical protein|uniref:Uncharacterized protein n=1 Tax=Mojavia pulchra JT2-VF2 TaxID=287848 RepID=A0A951PZB7_9NOST|nr:hypothetical protein [Mojavia pulchra JT2-VF2]